MHPWLGSFPSQQGFTRVLNRSKKNVQRSLEVMTSKIGESET